jgi:hypothetical protein
LGFAGDFHSAVAAGQRVIDDVKVSFLFRAHFLVSLDITSAAR